ncbi:hypothetical protein ARMGADRAFT_1037692 [Armillaria gallica]|uniref:Uncharacterized protein n=1 Tax=Armillaria gallica TaxID=47427 RepID=A0A2H3CWY5_ARMGA|nr:hypothetical protein ARMGADRAFT_1037692 [Armillaria gallica]
MDLEACARLAKERRRKQDDSPTDHLLWLEVHEPLGKSPLQPQNQNDVKQKKRRLHLILLFLMRLRSFMHDIKGTQHRRSRVSGTEPGASVDGSEKRRRSVYFPRSCTAWIETKLEKRQVKEMPALETFTKNQPSAPNCQLVPMPRVIRTCPVWKTLMEVYAGIFMFLLMCCESRRCGWEKKRVELTWRVGVRDTRVERTTLHVPPYISCRLLNNPSAVSRMFLEVVAMGPAGIDSDRCFEVAVSVEMKRHEVSHVVMTRSKSQNPFLDMHPVIKVNNRDIVALEEEGCPTPASQSAQVGIPFVRHMAT